MIVGHVQSGKTANYTGLVCKAADAGYRLIIVIAGFNNNRLRNQTQERIDEGFIGRDTGRLAHANKAQRQKIIGVGRFDQREFPVSLTNTLRDFDKATATTNTSQIGQYNVPVVLVIKKNPSTLKHLLEWLKEHSVQQNTQMPEPSESGCRFTQVGPGVSKVQFCAIIVRKPLPARRRSGREA